MKDFKFRVYLSWSDADHYLEVLVAPEGKGWDGPVARTLREDGVSVGVSDENAPLYVRIKEAQSIDRTFKSIANRIAKRAAPTSLQLDYLLNKATGLMNALVVGGSLRFKKATWAA